jgi:trehalose/maltose transport system substrate-binding protein
MANSVTQVYAGYQRLFQARSPDIDVLMIDIIWPGALAPHLVDLGPALGEAAGASLPANVRNNTVGGRLVAMPSYLGVGLLYYRKDLLARHGFPRPPATWDELEHQARVILAAERPAKPRLAGFVWQGNVYEGLTCNALEWQVSHGGGSIFDAEGRPDVTNPGALAAFRRAAAWVGGTSPIGVTAYMEEDARQVFQSGNAIFMRNWPYAYAAADAAGSPLRGKFGATALPAGPGGRSAGTLGGWEVGVSAYSRHRSAATELVRYLTCAEVQAWRAKERLFLPTIPALYHRPDVVAAQPSLASMETALAAAVARPSAATRELYNEASAIYHEGVAEILQGGDPAFVAGKMQRDLEELMASR